MPDESLGAGGTAELLLQLDEIGNALIERLLDEQRATRPEEFGDDEAKCFSVLTLPQSGRS